MSQNLTRGKWGEQIACGHLKKLGYQIVEQNFRSRFGEIDIIARHNDVIVFVEVKTRASHSMVSGAESITPAKQKKMRNTAKLYLTGFSNMPFVRFDVIIIEADGRTVKSIELIDDAF